MEMLSKSEYSELKSNEKIIETTKEGFVACGNALGAIQEKKLYRAEFETFEEYCKEKWGWHRAYVYRLIEAAEIKMSPIGDKIENEAQARAIAAVPKKERKAVLKKAEAHGKLTAASIAEAANEEPKKKEITLDKTGFVIPEDLVLLWTRGQEVQAMVTAIGRIKGMVKTAQEDDDLLYRALNFSSTLTHLENSQRSLKSALPYAVCWVCSGRNHKKCTMCKGTGLVSEFSWESFCPKEVKDIRSKVRGKK